MGRFGPRQDNLIVLPRAVVICQDKGCLSGRMSSAKTILDCMAECLLPRQSLIVLDCLAEWFLPRQCDCPTEVLHCLALPVDCLTAV